MPDQEEIAHQHELLRRHRARLRILSEQEATFGRAYAPAHILAEIDDIRSKISQIKAKLRSWGEQVDDLPDEGAPGALQQYVPEQQSASSTSAPKPKKPRQRKATGGPDVYISYHAADEAWVSEILLPRLEAAGLTAIIDYRDFEIGLPKLVNIERAVERSRHTLLVLTPDWLASDWNGFQGLLAASENPDGLQRKLLPLMLKPCKLPARIAFLEAADLTNPATRAARLDRLVQSLLDVREPRKNNAKGAPSSQPAAQPQSAVSAPKQRPVDFVIVTALEEEREAVLRKLPGYRKHDPSSQDIRTYYSADVPVAFPSGAQGDYHVIVLSLLGMGRVDAAVATGDAIRRWNPRYVMLVGIAGGIAENEASLGHILVSNQIIDYELQKQTDGGDKVRYSVHRADPRLLEAALHFTSDNCRKLVKRKRPVPGKLGRIIGPIATGDKVIAFKPILDKYRADWPKLIGVEMEAGGAAAAAFQSAEQPGFFMIRGVSDLADQDKGKDEVEIWRPYACDVAAAYAIALLKSGPVPLKD